MVRFLDLLVAWIFEDEANILVIFHLGGDSLPVLLVESFFARNQVLVIFAGNLQVDRFVTKTHQFMLVAQHWELETQI